MEQVPTKIQLLIRKLLANCAPLRVVLVPNFQLVQQQQIELVQYVNLVSIKIQLLIRILPVNLVLPRAVLVLNLLLVQQKQIEHVQFVE